MNKALFIVSIFLIIFICVPLLIYKANTLPEPTGEASGKIDIFREPVQELYEGEKFIYLVDNFQYTIEPVATYTIWCKVVGKKNYYNTLEDKLSPVDLCVVWGDLAEPENLQYIHFFQGNRCCNYTYDRNIPLDDPYVKSHGANMHIIPATENVMKAVKSIKSGQTIYLEGYLVKVYKYDRYIWGTSLERTDTGSHACEVFYVTRVRIGSEIYE